MLDHAFQRRREIERMLLSGKKLTVPKLMTMYSVGKNAIRRDFEIIGEELPVITQQGYNDGCFLMDGVGKHQNSLLHEQLECLEKLAVICAEKTGKPYCQSYMNLDRTVKGIVWQIFVVVAVRRYHF